MVIINYRRAAVDPHNNYNYWIDLRPLLRAEGGCLGNRKPPLATPLLKV